MTEIHFPRIPPCIVHRPVSKCKETHRTLAMAPRCVLCFSAFYVMINDDLWDLSLFFSRMHARQWIEDVEEKKVPVQLHTMLRVVHVSSGAEQAPQEPHRNQEVRTRWLNLRHGRTDALVSRVWYQTNLRAMEFIRHRNLEQTRKTRRTKNKRRTKQIDIRRWKIIAIKSVEKCAAHSDRKRSDPNDVSSALRVCVCV